MQCVLWDVLAWVSGVKLGQHNEKTWEEAQTVSSSEMSNTGLKENTEQDKMRIYF